MFGLACLPQPDALANAVADRDPTAGVIFQSGRGCQPTSAYPSAAWRRSYARRTSAERGFATIKDPAASDIARGWCRLMGLALLMPFITNLLIVRNQRIVTAWEARQQENERRAARGLPPKTRRRRRKTLAILTAAPP